MTKGSDECQGPRKENVPLAVEVLFLQLRRSWSAHPSACWSDLPGLCHTAEHQGHRFLLQGHVRVSCCTASCIRDTDAEGASFSLTGVLEQRELLLKTIWCDSATWNSYNMVLGLDQYEELRIYLNWQGHIQLVKQSINTSPNPLFFTGEGVIPE